MADHSSRQDWPRDLAARIPIRWRNEANVGLGLRWIAALGGMDRFFAIPGESRDRVLAHFEREIRMRAQRVRHLHEISDAAHSATRATRGILTFVMGHPDGAPFAAIETAAVHARLRQPDVTPDHREPGRYRSFHLGQPVVAGGRTALRVCVSAAMVSEIAERIEGMDRIEPKFQAWQARLDGLFNKWERLMEEISRARKTARAPSPI